ncbi:hypothetical protein BC831DRAFT_482662 [Entophlyctis helioformis]|nr:hypothetical protein BC831DRAFT_482662 [Entophlyctis helioformis]
MSLFSGHEASLHAGDATTALSSTPASCIVPRSSLSAAMSTRQTSLLSISESDGPLSSSSATTATAVYHVSSSGVTVADDDGCVSPRTPARPLVSIRKGNSLTNLFRSNSHIGSSNASSSNSSSIGAGGKKKERGFSAMLSNLLKPRTPSVDTSHVQQHHQQSSQQQQSWFRRNSGELADHDPASCHQPLQSQSQSLRSSLSTLNLDSAGKGIDSAGSATLSKPKGSNSRKNSDNGERGRSDSNGIVSRTLNFFRSPSASRSSGTLGVMRRHQPALGASSSFANANTHSTHSDASSANATTFGSTDAADPFSSALSASAPAPGTFSAPPSSLDSSINNSTTLLSSATGVYASPSDLSSSTANAAGTNSPGTDSNGQASTMRQYPEQPGAAISASSRMQPKIHSTFRKADTVQSSASLAPLGSISSGPAFGFNSGAPGGMATYPASVDRDYEVRVREPVSYHPLLHSQNASHASNNQYYQNHAYQQPHSLTPITTTGLASHASSASLVSLASPTSPPSAVAAEPLLTRKGSFQLAGSGKAPHPNATMNQTKRVPTDVSKRELAILTAPRRPAPVAVAQTPPQSAGPITPDTAKFADLARPMINHLDEHVYRKTGLVMPSPVADARTLNEPRHMPPAAETSPSNAATSVSYHPPYSYQQSHMQVQQPYSPSDSLPQPQSLVYPPSQSLSQQPIVPPKPLPSLPSLNSSADPKEREEADRSKRQRDIADLMSGVKRLSNRFTSRYILGELLGDGAFGFVVTAKRIMDNKEMAVKFIVRAKIARELWVPLDNTTSELVPLEVALLRRLRHPNIISYAEHIHEEDYVLLITELHGTSWDISNRELNPTRNEGLKTPARTKSLDVGAIGAKPSVTTSAAQPANDVVRKRTSCDLFECIDAHTRFPEHTARKIFAQIALVVDFMNSQGFVHRDLKDENIVIDADYKIKLIDFGSASCIPSNPDKYFTKFNGTAHFASPEIANGNAYRGPEAEVWALGVLLYTIVFGENPFQNRTEIIKGQYHYPSKISADLRDLLDSMLCYDMTKRANINQVVNHVWIRNEVLELRWSYSSSAKSGYSAGGKGQSGQGHVPVPVPVSTPATQPPSHASAAYTFASASPAAV